MLESMATFWQTNKPQAHIDHCRTKLNWQHSGKCTDLFVVLNGPQTRSGVIKVENTLKGFNQILAEVKLKLHSIHRDLYGGCFMQYNLRLITLFNKTYNLRYGEPWRHDFH